MPQYKNIISVWLNPSKEGKGCYLAIKNETDESIVIESGKSIYANMNTRVPIASKSVKVEDQVKEMNEEDVDSTTSDIPF